MLLMTLLAMLFVSVGCIVFVMLFLDAFDDIIGDLVCHRGLHFVQKCGLSQLLFRQNPGSNRKLSAAMLALQIFPTSSYPFAFCVGCFMCSVCVCV